MINYIISFFRPSLLFQMNPAPLEGLGLNILLVLFSLNIIAGVATIYVVRQKKFDSYINSGMKKIRTLFFTMGFFGFLYTFFAYEGAVILSARIWLLVWVASVIIWTYFIIIYFMKHVPRLKMESVKKRNFSKYLRG